MRSARRLASLALLLALAGCAREAAKPASTLTEAQRDSAIARSNLPGAGAVQGALGAAGKEAGHAAAMDSLAR